MLASGAFSMGEYRNIQLSAVSRRKFLSFASSILAELHN
jgi:hypothetical protein